MRRRSRFLQIVSIIGVLAAGAARAETVARVQENVPGQRDANRHRLFLENRRTSQIVAASCRVEDTAALGVLVDLGLRRQWEGQQQLVVIRDDGAKRNVEFAGSENFMVLGGGTAVSLLGWALDGKSVSFQHTAATVSFDLAGPRAPIARFASCASFEKVIAGCNPTKFRCMVGEAVAKAIIVGRWGFAIAYPSCRLS
jgi:hypothetical protein